MAVVNPIPVAPRPTFAIAIRDGRVLPANSPFALPAVILAARMVALAWLNLATATSASAPEATEVIAAKRASAVLPLRLTVATPATDDPVRTAAFATKSPRCLRDTFATANTTGTGITASAGWAAPSTAGLTVTVITRILAHALPPTSSSAPLAKDGSSGATSTPSTTKTSEPAPGGTKCAVSWWGRKGEEATRGEWLVTQNDNLINSNFISICMPL